MWSPLFTIEHKENVVLNATLPLKIHHVTLNDTPPYGVQSLLVPLGLLSHSELKHRIVFLYKKRKRNCLLCKNVLICLFVLHFLQDCIVQLPKIGLDQISKDMLQLSRRKLNDCASMTKILKVDQILFSFYFPFFLVTCLSKKIKCYNMVQ